MVTLVKLACALEDPSLSLLAIDLGNTRTKVALFKGDQIDYQSAYLTHDGTAKSLLPWLKEKFSTLETVSHLALSSVVPIYDSYWVDLSKALNIPLFTISATTVPWLSFEIDNPSQMGADRIAGLLGARKNYPHDHIVTVDMGTAITLNFLTKEGCYKGGAILPGLQTSIQSLTEKTAQLASISLTPSPLSLGKNTHDQMQLNVHLYKAGIKTLVQEMAPQAFGPNSLYKIIGTGGDAPLFQALGLFDVIEPDLKLHGVQQAFLAHRKLASGSNTSPN